MLDSKAVKCVFVVDAEHTEDLVFVQIWRLMIAHMGFGPVCDGVI